MSYRSDIDRSGQNLSFLPTINTDIGTSVKPRGGPTAAWSPSEAPRPCGASWKASSRRGLVWNLTQDPTAVGGLAQATTFYLFIYLTVNLFYFLRLLFLFSKRSLGAAVKLLPCDLEIMGSSHRNNLMQSKIRLCTIDSFLRPHIGGCFVHRTALLLFLFPLNSLSFLFCINLFSYSFPP